MFPKVIALLVSKHLVLNDLVFAPLKGRRDDVDVYFAISDDLDQLAELLYLSPFFALALDRLHGCAVKINVHIIDLVVVTELDVVVS